MKFLKNAKTVFALCGILCAGVTVFCVSYLGSVRSSYSVEQFFPKEHTVLRDHAEVTKKFQLHQLSPMMVLLEIPANSPDTWLSPKRVKALNAWTESVEYIPNVKSVISFANIDAAFNIDNELRIGPLSEVVPPKRWNEQLEAMPILRQLFHKSSDKAIVVTIEPSLSSNVEMHALTGAVEESLREMKWDVNSHLSGVPVVQTQLASVLEKEVGKYLLLCLLGFCVVFFAFYRNWAAVPIAAGFLAAANFTTLGLLGFLGVPLSVLLSTLPMIVSIVAVSLMIHTFHLWAAKVRPDEKLDFATRWKRTVACVRELLLANFLGSFTTMVGFAALATVPLPIVREYALVTSLSILWVFVFVQFLFLVTMPFFTPVLRSWTSARAWWSLRILRRPSFAVIGVGVAFVAAFLTVGSLNFSTRLFDDLDPAHPLSVTLSVLDRDFGGVVTLDVVATSAEENYWLEKGRMETLAAIAKEIRGIEGVGSVVAASDFLSPEQMKTREGVAEGFFLYSMSTADPMRQFMDAGFQSARWSVRLQDLPGKQVGEIREQVKEAIRAQAPGLEIKEAGIALYSHLINQEVSRELVYGFWVSLAIIGIFLGFVFRSARWALVSCLPNLVPPAFLVTALAYMQTPIKPAIGLIFSIALGLAFNNTVYLLARLKSLYRKGASYLPVKRTFLVEGNACLSESLLTCIGFMIFLTSDFQLNLIFGAYMILSIFAGFLGDLVFLPSVMRMFPRMLTSPKDTPADEETPTQPKSRDEIPPAAAAAALAALCLVFAAPEAHAQKKKVSSRVDPEAVQILEKVRGQVEAKSDQAKVTLRIIEANGDVKTRVLQLQSLREKDTYYAMVRVQSPADVKGTAMLAEIKKDQENQWLYLPSTKQVRRVVSTKKSGGVLGSELSPEDLNSAAIQGAMVKVRKKVADRTVLEIRPRRKSSQYSAVLMTVTPDARPLRLDYFSGKNAVKTVEFMDYKTLDGVQRAQKIVIKNLTNKRGTEVFLEDLKVNVDFSESDFSVNALKRAN